MLKKIMLFVLLIGSIAAQALEVNFSECVNATSQSQIQKGLNCSKLCSDFLRKEISFDNMGAVKMYCASYPYASLKRAVDIVKSNGTKEFGVALRVAMNYEKVTIDCALEKKGQQEQLILDQAIFSCLK